MSLTKVSYSMINGEVLNVLDFGALGDGSNDDTAAIQAAITAAEAFSGTVYIPEGVFLLYAPLQITSGITLVGNGRESTILRVVDTGQTISAIKTSVFVDKLTIKNLRIEASNTTNAYVPVSTWYGKHGIEFKDVHHWLLDQVDVWYFNNDGVHLEESYIGYCQNCHFAGNNGWGIWAGLTVLGVNYANHAVSVQNTEVQGNKTGGIYVEGSSAFNILNSTIEANSTVGVDVIYATGFTIVGNYFESNGAYHIRVGNTVSAAGPLLAGTISGNHLENPSTSGVSGGIYVNEAYGVNVYGNFAFNTVKSVRLTSNAHNCYVGPQHSTDPIENQSVDSVVISIGDVQAEKFTPINGLVTWNPSSSGLSGTVSSVTARYSEYGSNVTCYVTIQGTGLASTADVTTLSLPVASARTATGYCLGGGSVATGGACFITGSTVVLPTIASTSRIDLSFTYAKA